MFPYRIELKPFTKTQLGITRHLVILADENNGCFTDRVLIKMGN